MEMIQYVEINLIGIILLLTILVIDRKSHHRNVDATHQHFINLLIINIVILLLDNSIYFLRGIAYEGIIVVTHILCCSFFVLHTLFGYEWIRYIISSVYPRYRMSKLTHFLLLLPCIASNAFVVSSPWTGWVYSLSDTNVYARGPLIWITFAVSSIYLLMTTIILFIEYRNPKANRRPGEYLQLLWAPIPMVIGNLLQLYFYGLSIVWITSAISLLIIFANYQNNLLSRDDLTGLYNRRQTDAQLRWELSRQKNNDDYLLVAMIDVDYFKKINDQYGHLKGDEALTTVAKTMTNNCRKTDFIGRWGGDEFLIIGHIRSDTDAAIIFKRLKNKLIVGNASGEYPYSLSLSIGYILTPPHSSGNADDILNAADQKMYEIKQRRKDLAGTSEMCTDYTVYVNIIKDEA